MFKTLWKTEDPCDTSYSLSLGKSGLDDGVNYLFFTILVRKFFFRFTEVLYLCRSEGYYDYFRRVFSNYSIIGHRRSGPLQSKRRESCLQRVCR